MLALRRSASELVSAIETGTLDALVDTLKSSETPTVSSNFCEALTRFEDSALKCSLELGVTWASSIARPPGDALRSSVRIDHSYSARIEEVRRELRASEKHVEDAFIGTVERLDGDMDADGNRSGEVVRSLLLAEGEQVHVRTHLNAKDYATADRAHMTHRAYARVVGSCIREGMPTVRAKLVGLQRRRWGSRAAKHHEHECRTYVCGSEIDTVVFRRFRRLTASPPLRATAQPARSRA